ncbi:iron-containing alcohol dehydrogenase [Salinimicrobium sp. TH3]|uniref:iron-containing alcohol dehydrogenase n=1 Tax=Salinimicrobium sp. TH3 TaxID=2997342 RepID=UPI0022742643|nr:iron-containing alcohol dehydrogenase [Salinimicrobium sp. TH3]MCY2687770.1 iron-containing alcohol dehydrogenase [Salinimicrobium sp. TH3]
MVYKQLSYLPIIFQVDEGIILNIEKYLHRNKLQFHKVLVVSGSTYSYSHAVEVAQIGGWDLYILESNTHTDVEHLRRMAETGRFDLILAIGGGKVLDTVKRVSYLSNINHISIPTIISNDGLISPIAVIQNSSGKTESLPGMMPMGVVIDLDIIRNSPVDYIRAASGDILSNLSATNDWVIAQKENKENINDIAFHLSKGAANSLVHFSGIDLHKKSFLRMVVQGQVNSGIAMSLAGTSRPCSGSEHLISHALNYLELTENVLHGVQVASISLFTLFLQNKLHSIHVEYAVATHVPLIFTDLIKREYCLKEIFFKALEMRPGRFTVLDHLTAEEFVEKVDDYTEYIGSHKKSNYKHLLMQSE